MTTAPSIDSADMSANEPKRKIRKPIPSELYRKDGKKGSYTKKGTGRFHLQGPKEYIEV